MAVVLPQTTEEEVDQFEFELVELVANSNLVPKAQMPAFLIAHILRGVYDDLCKDKPDWDKVLNGT